MVSSFNSIDSTSSPLDKQSSSISALFNVESQEHETPKSLEDVNHHLIEGVEPVISKAMVSSLDDIQSVVNSMESIPDNELDILLGAYEDTELSFMQETKNDSTNTIKCDHDQILSCDLDILHAQTSTNKRRKIENNYGTIVDEIKEINSKLVETSLDVVSDTSIDTLSKTGVSSGTIVKCSYKNVCIPEVNSSPGVVYYDKPAEFFVQLLVPAEYPASPPRIFKSGFNVLSEPLKKPYEEMLYKFDLSLHELPKQNSLGDMARKWDSCVRGVLLEFVHKNVKGLSSRAGLSSLAKEDAFSSYHPDSCVRSEYTRFHFPVKVIEQLMARSGIDLKMASSLSQILDLILASAAICQEWGCYKFLKGTHKKKGLTMMKSLPIAFLYGTIEEEVYYATTLLKIQLSPDRVYKVEKALYRLHQAPRAWYETLSTYLLDNGFQRGKIDKTLFIKRYKGELTFFLGLQEQQKKDGIFISQDKYVVEILKKFRFTEVKTASTPMETQKPLLKDEDGEEVDVHMYRLMIGLLMYLTSSGPDIMFAVCACARYQVNPKVSHLHAVKRIFRYLKGQSKLDLWYPKDSPFDLVAYTDSDYAGASLDRKFTT
ncbi:uncharacterized mitochondrial protein-like protein [Tanacetum coccineum]